MTIGIRLPRSLLILTKGRDFRWHFQHLDAAKVPTNFPPGTMFLELQTHPTTTVWPILITGYSASIKVESEVADTVPANTKWQLVFIPAGEPAGGEAIAHGTVLRQG